ncbi:MAG: Spx/MgsR family RNA polymerase-binding regulatory protein [Ignavibacteriales bacterium]|nr:Spx/MgsR family RNA polymerase-binding regulatory protein [Ignavibacteriales bacterium]
MEKIVVYEKPTCTTCRKTIKMLNEMGVEFDRINYYIKRFSKNKLKALLNKMNMKPSELLRKNEDAFKKLDLKNNDYSEDQILNFMVADHNLIQRPIVEKGAKAVLGRPIEKIKDLF